jgi:hypothetical protein
VAGAVNRTSANELREAVGCQIYTAAAMRLHAETGTKLPESSAAQETPCSGDIYKN